MTTDPAASNDAPPGLAVAAGNFRAAAPAAGDGPVPCAAEGEGVSAARRRALAIGRSGTARMVRAAKPGRQAWRPHR